MDKPITINGRPLEPPALDIIDALRDGLYSNVELIDLDEGRVHAKMSTWWFTYPAPVAELRTTVVDQSIHGRTIDTRVNRRWVLRLTTTVWHAPESLQTATWAARKLAPYLSDEPELAAAVKGTGRGGGSAPPAELGIPVWWARRIRS